MTKQKDPKRYLLYLINPRYKYKHYATQQETSELIGKARMTVPLQLPLIAALTPDHYDIKIIEDDAVDIESLPRPDLVGITTMAATSGRAFEIADYFSQMDVPVVLGGSYASFRAEECLSHARHVVVGEAEGAWQAFLRDFERGEAKPVYKNDASIPFATSPKPRWDLVEWNKMMNVGVETSRGCSFKCNFCVVNKLFGRKMRYRDVDDVVREIEAAPLKRIFFVADNFALKKSYARELVRRLKPLDITWICQCSIEVARDEALLESMADAGCIAILIGFESLNECCLADIQKHQNHVTDFEHAIERIHQKGMHVLGSFIIGFDTDTKETFGYIYEFIERNNLVYSMLNVLSVAPGTELYEKMKSEGRIELVDPSYRNGVFPCIRYENFTQREILDALFNTLERIFSWESISERAIRLFEKGTFLKGGNEKVPFGEKVSVSLLLLKRFLFTRDKTKRQMFFHLFKLTREKRLSVNDLVVFLLNMEGYQLYLEKARTYLPAVRQGVDAVDAACAARSSEENAIPAARRWAAGEREQSSV